MSTTNGTCSVFAGNVNSVVFVWQVESAPGVWQDLNLFPISGISYSTEQRINAGGTVISSILTINVAYGTDEATWNYRVLAQGSGGCSVATSLNEAIAVRKNRWLGTLSSAWNDPANWSCNRVPSSASSAIILPAVNNPIVAVTANAKELTLQPGSLLTVASGYNLTVSGAVTVLGDGNLTMENNANLMQTSYTGPNSGSIHVFRNSSPLMRQDYTLWSSPVTAQNLLSFSPLTLSNRFYDYNALTNTYSSVNPSSNNFETGKGYLIRMPNNHPTTPTIWNGQFTGVPNNGTINLTTVNGGSGLRFNAIGNPYPSPVRMSSFVNGNNTRITGTLYFWRKTNSAATDPGYCTWTLAGFVSNGETQVVNPNGILRTGQGFLVEMLNAETTVVFNNSMRIGNTADQFFKSTSANEELIGDKIYLNVQNGSSADKSQMLLGYFDEATEGVDYAIDGKALEDSKLSLTTLINGEDYVIQGRSAFDVSDVVPLTFKTDVAGQFTISIEQLQGVFAGHQAIYLKDKAIGVLHDLKQSNYNFVSEIGNFSNRFEVVYANTTLGNSDVASDENNFIVYSDSELITVRNSGSLLQSVRIYDLQGRLVAQKNDIKDNIVEVPLNPKHSVWLVEIQNTTGIRISKKIIH
ncbi:hypothetical protein [Flavobacterium sp.]|uniref:hypothetical protein n=1 Tax=Flavobacterium sp. TaxID=239 RepID=UPI0028BD237B|nr:hypothetical protein [Flavobacterium sp.]